MVREDGEILAHHEHYFEKERDMEPDSYSDSKGNWHVVFVVTFMGQQPYC